MTAPYRIGVHHHILPPDYLSVPAPALSANPHALRSLCELVPPTQILFGSDVPFAPEPVTHLSVTGLARYDAFDEAARRAIERDNALSLLPTLRDRVGGYRRE
ncbi:MAG TPA: amidohydrolase family protein [Candidatus Eisenbacteria bacterium]|nr:amidohydrolase family protein [Candidatus Eisenbacteria bacterium]